MHLLTNSSVIVTVGKDEAVYAYRWREEVQRLHDCGVEVNSHARHVGVLMESVVGSVKANRDICQKVSHC